MGRRPRLDLSRMTPRQVVVVLIVAAIAYGSSHVSCGKKSGPGEEGDLAQAHARQLSDVLVESGGRVVFLMGDDTRGSRHQHFLVEVPEGFTVKIAHNIDLAKRVPAAVGDEVEFRGVYEFNEKGGVVHWTHHDPDGRHPGGWIKHRGKVYE